MEVLIVLDMLKEIWEKWGEEKRKIAPKIKKLIDLAKKGENSVLYVCHVYRLSDKMYWKSHEKHILIGTPGAEIIDLLKPETEETIVRKRGISGFYGSDLEHTLRSMMASTLILTGTATNLSVLHTAVDAFQRHFQVIVVEDCTVGHPGNDEHEWALRHLRGYPFQIPVLTSDEVIERFYKVGKHAYKSAPARK